MIYFVSVPLNGSDVFIKPSAATAQLSRSCPARLRDQWHNTDADKKTPESYLTSTKCEYRWWGWASSEADAIMRAREGCAQVTEARA